MGFARDKLSADSCATIASTLFIVKSEDNQRSELIGLCPLHEDRQPSFAYNFDKDVFNCSACHQSGDLIDLWCRVKNLDKSEGFRRFCSFYKIKMDSSRETGNGSSRGSAGNDPSSSPGSGNISSSGKKKIPIIPEGVWEKMKPLPDSFIKRLSRERGWSREIIAKLDLRLQTVRLDKDGTIKPIERASRVAIPVRNDDGALVNIRLYKPGAKVRKIISWGKGYGSAQLFPPGGTLSDTAPVILCEGESDTICALSRGLNAITQTSKLVNWPEQQLKHFRGKDVVIAYDADAAGEEYQYKAAESLSGIAKRIRCLVWPESMGCIFGYWPFKHGEDLTDFFIRHEKKIDEFERIIEATKDYTPPDEGTPPDPEDPGNKDEPPPPLNGKEFFHLNNQGRWTFKPRWLANRLREETPLLYEDKTGLLYRYNGKHWQEYSEEHLEARALELLGDESSRSRSADSAKQARLLSIMPPDREVNDSGLSCLENGMLDIETLKMVPHHQDHMATYMLPVSFIPVPERTCKRWLQYLEETIQTRETIMQAQEFAGYCLTKETRFGKCLFLLGPGSDGKSKFIKVLKMLVGEQNTAAVAIKDLENEFYRSMLYNKLLNISTEVSTSYFDSSFFKGIVTGDPVSAAFKNKDPFEFEPFCKMVYSGNDLPRVRDTSDGFYRRWLPIEFKRQFFGKDDDTRLIEKFQDELSEIYRWALTGLHRLWEQGGFTQSDETDKLLTVYRKDNNPVLAFLEDKCIIRNTEHVSKDDLFRSYRNYCDQYNFMAKNKTHFFRELKSSLRTLKRTIAEGRAAEDPESGKRPRTLKGIGLKPKVDNAKF